MSAVFGRATSFALYETAASPATVVPNEGAASEHGAGTGAAAFLVEKGVRVLLAPEVGPKAKAALDAAGIRIVGVKAGQPLGEALASATATE